MYNFFFLLYKNIKILLYKNCFAGKGGRNGESLTSEGILILIEIFKSKKKR